MQFFQTRAASQRTITRPCDQVTSRQVGRGQAANANAKTSRKLGHNKDHKYSKEG